MTTMQSITQSVVQERLVMKEELKKARSWSREVCRWGILECYKQQVIKVVQYIPVQIMAYNMHCIYVHYWTRLFFNLTIIINFW